MNYEIRFCALEEYELLVSFIKEYWNKNHIFVKSKQALDFQHLDRKNKRYNFIVAYNTISKEFDAILGFILLSQYTIHLKDENIWLSIWKSKKNCPGLGLRLIRNLEQNLKPKHMGALGLSIYSRRFYKLFNYDKIAILDHFYIKNEKIKHFKIADFSKTQRKKERKKKKYFPSLYNIKSITSLEFQKSNLKFYFTPKKDLCYFIERYHKNPFYSYKNYGIYKNGILIAAFFARIIEQNNAKCMSIVDWIGKFPKNLQNAFEVLLQTNQCEFVSFICYIKNPKPIYAMGFKLLNKDKNIIPVYFEPFVKENVDIYFAFKSKSKNYTIFKGDSDQDRINKS
ncbi:TPA: hypothetical protein ACX8FT_001592 [Campylobacter coli]